MKLTIPLLLLLSGCASLTVGPQEDGSVVAQFGKDTVQQCQAQGGCLLVSKQFLEAYAKQTAAKMCGRDI